MGSDRLAWQLCWYVFVLVVSHLELFPHIRIMLPFPFLRLCVCCSARLRRSLTPNAHADSIPAPIGVSLAPGKLY